MIAYVYGGQGSMNVNSWAPDNRRLAFVSNSDGAAALPQAARSIAAPGARLERLSGGFEFTEGPTPQPIQKPLRWDTPRTFLHSGQK